MLSYKEYLRTMIITRTIEFWQPVAIIEKINTRCEMEISGILMTAIRLFKNYSVSAAIRTVIKS